MDELSFQNDDSLFLNWNIVNSIEINNVISSYWCIFIKTRSCKLCKPDKINPFLML